MDTTVVLQMLFDIHTIYTVAEDTFWNLDPFTHTILSVNWQAGYHVHTALNGTKGCKACWTAHNQRISMRPFGRLNSCTFTNVTASGRVLNVKRFHGDTQVNKNLFFITCLVRGKYLLICFTAQLSECMEDRDQPTTRLLMTTLL